MPAANAVITRQGREGEREGVREGMCKLQTRILAKMSTGAPLTPSELSIIAVGRTIRTRTKL